MILLFVAGDDLQRRKAREREHPGYITPDMPCIAFSLHLLRGSGKRRRGSDRVVFEYVKSNRGARQVLLIYERQAGALP